ncbi:CbrC family protein [Larkinella soli]|uniref:CbrC family protein n=1 Tax=Larkinella soli TaxID=1770527 RepID=UPI000FFC0900|nr:CbrC family protein [Larkinella soli]
MTFKYFDKPEIFVGFLDEKTTCDTCGEFTRCFDAEPFYGEETLAAVCPSCLEKGRLYGMDVYTCEGDFSELKRQLTERHPDLDENEIDAMAEEKTRELEKTTPHLVTWQDWLWPCADGDYCQFIGYGSRPLYNRLSRDFNGQALFESSLYYTLRDDSDADALWEEEMPRKEVRTYEESSRYSTLFYVFKSLHSDQIITTWDSD